MKTIHKTRESFQTPSVILPARRSLGEGGGKANDPVQRVHCHKRATECFTAFSLTGNGCEADLKVLPDRNVWGNLLRPVMLFALLGLGFTSGCRHTYYGPDGAVTIVEYEE